MIKIIEVTTPKQRKEFLNFPFKIYKENKFYIPPLRSDEKKIFDSRCNYWDVTESIFFLAYKDDELVGRIQGINQLQYNEIHNSRQIRFTRFDCIHDQEVANALFDAVIAWGKSKNMDSIVGPLGYSDFEREGLLIEGFNEKQTYEEQYNFPYYKELIKAYGFEKDTDWLEFNLTRKEDINPKVFDVAEEVLKENKLHLAPINGISHDKYVKKYYKPFFNLLDEAYKKLYGVVPSNRKVEDALARDLGAMVEKKYFRVILDENDEMISFAVLIPYIGDAVRRSKGRLFPFGIFRILRALKNPKIIDLLLIGVHPDYQNKGIPSVYLKLLYDMFDEGVESFETNLNLEDNHEIMNCWKYFDARQHKRRRCFIKHF